MKRQIQRDVGKEGSENRRSDSNRTDELLDPLLRRGWPMVSSRDCWRFRSTFPTSVWRIVPPALLLLLRRLLFIVIVVNSSVAARIYSYEINAVLSCSWKNIQKERQNLNPFIIVNHDHFPHFFLFIFFFRRLFVQVWLSNEIIVFVQIFMTTYLYVLVLCYIREMFEISEHVVSVSRNIIRVIECKIMNQYLNDIFSYIYFYIFEHLYLHLFFANIIIL